MLDPCCRLHVCRRKRALIVAAAILVVFSIGKWTTRTKSDATLRADSKMVFSPNSILPFYHSVVHLDFKGAPPRMPYLLRLLPSLKKLGASALLVEWEDMFPYDGPLRVTAKPYAYTRTDIAAFLDLAHALQLDVIPLIPSFGHMEFVTEKLPFIGLREVHLDLSTVCPTNSESLAVVKAMIDNILAVHTRIKWLHVGGDEVWQINQCPRCNASGLTPRQLYMHHMVPVMQHVRTVTDNRVAPIIWDDMLRTWTEEEMMPLAGLTELMMWCYDPAVSAIFTDALLGRFSRVFGAVWMAGAFKGANHHSSDLVHIQPRVENVLAWLQIIGRLAPKTTLRGVVLTGWSRFSHTNDLCEMLPSSIPSLALCLAALNNGRFDPDVHAAVSRALGFRGLINMGVASNLDVRLEPADYLGSDLLDLIVNVKLANLHVENASLAIGCLDPKRTDPSPCNTMVSSAIDQRRLLLTATRQLRQLEASANQTMWPYFYEETISRWVLLRVTAPLRMLTVHMGRANYIFKQLNITPVT